MKADRKGNRIHEIEKYFFSQGKNYLANREDDLREIKKSLQDTKDKEKLLKIQKIGHKIKGSAGLYGFTELSDIGYRIETTAKSGDILKLPIVVNEFQLFLTKAESQEI